MNRNRRVPSYGSGFDVVTRNADPGAFLAWWNRKSFFPVSRAEADTRQPATWLRQAA